VRKIFFGVCLVFLLFIIPVPAFSAVELRPAGVGPEGLYSHDYSFNLLFNGAYAVGTMSGNSVLTLILDQRSRVWRMGSGVVVPFTVSQGGSVIRTMSMPAMGGWQVLMEDLLPGTYTFKYGSNSSGYPELEWYVEDLESASGGSGGDVIVDIDVAGITERLDAISEQIGDIDFPELMLLLGTTSDELDLLAASVELLNADVSEPLDLVTEFAQTIAVHIHLILIGAAVFVILLFLYRILKKFVV
jgi:hypothetical protein